jgi:SAM-dependent methyltransferase
LAEFTGERLIPGQVDDDLLNEHLARYAFAARLARGKRVLDAGCGAGYGSAELARVALSVTGADVAPEAVGFATEHYRAPNLNFEQASCEALPHPDGCFDLVVSFEVLEHLSEWREFLVEARRVLSSAGQFIVSTPNKLYYTESRGAAGENPYHVHEFTFAEFRGELLSIFPHVSFFLENHVEGVGFQPCEPSSSVDVRVDATDPEPDGSHFFLAVCAHRPQMGNPTFVFIPQSANVLRERERHIALLESELAAKDGWLENAKQELLTLHSEHEATLAELEQRNQWAESLNAEIAERRARVVALQEELALEQQHARQAIGNLEQMLQAKGEELVQAVAALHSTEKDLEDRTAWALRLDEELRKLEALLAEYRGSRWVRLGRKLGVGPVR